MSRAINLVTLLRRLEFEFQRSLKIIETGTIRALGLQYEEGDGHSTRYIAEFINRSIYAHEFYSVDLDISTAKKYLSQLGLLKYVGLVQSDSIVFLTKQQDVDFVYLDSANDPDHILAEFLTIKDSVNLGGIVVIDDCIPVSHEVLKCHKVLPWLQEHNQKYEIIGRHLVVYF